jgi:hypothetical protein
LLTAFEVDLLKSVRWVFTVAALFTIGHAFAETEDDEVDPDRDFELPGAEVAGNIGDGGLDLKDADFVGSPLKKLAKRWPEDLVIAPIPGRSPQLGWKLTLAGGYFLQSRKEDSEVAPSLLGGFAMIAENGSYAYGGGANLHLMDDKLRVKAGAGYMDVRYRFYGIGNDDGENGISVDILQEAPMYFASASWRVWNKLYVGLGYLGGEVDTRLRFTLPDTPFFDPSVKLDIGAYAIPIEFDTRDHEQFPRNGWLVSGRAMLYRESAGGDFDAETFKISVNHYRPMREQDVLAFRATVSSTSGEAPFFLLSTFGGSTDLRGYPSGRYRDRMMYALQSEYRWQFNDRWIFTGFVGFGEVADNFGDFGENFLPAAGIGTRFVLSKKHRVGLSVDIAVGKDGTEFYFGVGEAF